MGACLYVSDLSDEEWAVLAPLLQWSHPAGRRIYPLRRLSCKDGR
jgi:transposase